MIAVAPKTKPRIDLKTLELYDHVLRGLEANAAKGLPETHVRAFSLLTDMLLVRGDASIVIECCNVAFEELADQLVNQ